MVIGSRCIYPIKVEEVATLLGTAVANCKVQTIAKSEAALQPPSSGTLACCPISQSTAELPCLTA